MAPPEFPPPFVIERTRSLGFGTGPWTRDRLVQAWGAPTADKYIGEAKGAGWLVSPSRGVYHVPTAQDIMLVSWLAEPARSEFLISRTLAAANLRAWCLSAWCRDQGLELGAPLFVTDLSNLDGAPRALDRKVLQADAAKALERPAPPFLENILIVPAMPASSGPHPRLAMVPEAEEAIDRRRMEKQTAQLAFGIVGLIALAIEKDIPKEPTSGLKKHDERETAAKAIPYVVDGRVVDEAWVLALLASIGTSRIEELVAKKLKASATRRADAIQRWASLLGPPQPITSWKETLREGPFPYLLVPPFLWAEMGADQAARRYRMLDQLTRS